MGSKCSSLNRNNNLRKIGEKTKTKSTQSLIKLTNTIIVPEYKKFPEEDYQKIKFIGEGTFAQVYAVKNKLTGLIRALKIFPKRNNPLYIETKILNEINILIHLDHPNIYKIFSIYSNEKNYSFITELCSGGELFEEINLNGPFSEKKSSYIMYQLLSAVNYLHKNNIIHRDIKPENILIICNEEEDEDLLYIKLCDFGTAKFFEEGNKEKSFVGSYYYMAPEVIKKNYNEKCDLWSCGVILYILLNGKVPFNGKNKNEILSNIQKGEFDIENPHWKKISKSGKDLIYKLLEQNISKRLNAEEALQHNWFKENKSKELFTTIENKIIIDKLCNNLINYKSNSVIQETALAYLVHNFNQTRNVINACKLFCEIDEDNDGKINEEELYLGLSKKIKRKNLKSDCNKIFNNIDMNHNIYVEYEEFVRGAVNKEKFLSENVLKFAYNYFDKDDNGEIDYQEIEMIFKDNIVDKNHIEEGLKKIIDEVDVNHDGKISFEEFCIVMKKMLVP